MSNFSHVLIVNDSRSFAQMTAHIICQKLHIHTLIATTLKDADQILLQHPHQKILVIAGLTLADASGADVVKHFTDRGLPVIVVTAMFDEDTRNRILTLPVIDYVVKDSPLCIDHMIQLLQSLERNHHHTALVVDDSRTLRQQSSAILALLGFHVLQAENGALGLAMLAAHPNIALVVTDYDMPEMDGLEMTRRMRQTHPREKLAIIGMSGQLSYTPGFLLSPRFLKCGANDFLHKPYVREEFQSRVEQNMASLDSYARLRDLATKDFLTGLWNRRHFFATAPSVMEKSANTAIAMLDIDFFKRVNDTHGHDAGDAVLRSVAKVLKGCIHGQDLLARFGGEEFCLISPDLPADHIYAYYERIRNQIAATSIAVDGKSLSVTLSIGVCNLDGLGLEDKLAMADSALYHSKTNGRNRVTFAQASETA